MPVSRSGVILLLKIAPIGDPIGLPPANAGPLRAVWQEVQSLAAARYRPRSISPESAWPVAVMTRVRVGASTSHATASTTIRNRAPAAIRARRTKVLMLLLSGVHQGAWGLQVLFADGLRRPVGQRADNT